MALVLKKRAGKAWKERELAELVEYIEKHPTIAVFELTGARASVLHELRAKLRQDSVFKITKKTLFVKAAEKANMPQIKNLVEDKTGPIGFIFTNLSAFKLALILQKNKVLMHAKSGEKADVDVIIPECNTGIPPGPILSELGKMRIPTRIDGGSIWIAKDTLVAKKGDVISSALASLLMKLDIKAVLKGINIKAAYEGGRIYSGDELIIDLDKVKQDIASAVKDAFNFAVNVGYVTRETLAHIIALAYMKALAVAIEASYITKDTLPYLLRKAHVEALSLQSAAKVQ
ncbi:MAG: 50S ribosomal protein L10 [Nitrososphaerota archaeon]|nr:50S ribosomal protein L10 [Aigarchaeota archaeon]MDW8076567.1 50S ribosomal protein L10 [Nitrososphaerota archaeon]